MTPSQTLLARRAHHATHKAIARGELVKPDTCEQCGLEPKEARDMHAHHDDYRRPLAVRWLCVMCHRRHHERVDA